MPLSAFDYAFLLTLEAEGGYTVDTGGPTNFGVTQATFSEWLKQKGLHAGRDVRYLDKETAKQIYEDLYWKPMLCPQVKNKHVAAELFDTAVNCGPFRAALFAQQALNAVLRKEGIHLEEDGKIGQKTLDALNFVIEKKRVYPLLVYMNVAQGWYYLQLNRQYPDRFSKYINGWAKRCTLTLDAFKETLA